MTPAPIATLLTDRRFAILAAALLTSPYWTSALAKLLDWNSAVAEAAHFGLQPAMFVAALTILVQLVGSFAIVFRRGAWLGAGALGVFTALATLVAHPFWTIAEPMARFHERNTFLEHVGLIGGLMLAAILRERTR
ncbi:DoxX family protein [Sphingobium lignivorans]|uniref:Membrane protein YphA (DoxX/SURF4 family) n=1 Tax=Sphingobium lignivorans TaxID=2735886 RepID=A0ABR6NHF5_9SPHN|nr:DoxX family protein [Sphingobium lignivorans]MBB5986696.1 putative membrane protein YphA (DoxX/SURF4 family) [Sphingobium lignivorans]